MNPLFLTDSYKLSHKGFMTEGTESIYSNMTPRSSKYLPVNHEDFDDKIVWFGLQAVLKQMHNLWDKEFFSRNKEEVLAETKRLFDAYLGVGAVGMDHFAELHDLGYLPIQVKSLPEGSRVDIKVPFFTIRNTDNRFAWLTNYLETYLSAQLWKPATVATIIREYRKLTNDWATKTTGSTDGTQFQIHGFEFRGMSGWEDAAACAAGFLLSSNGTDTIPALPYLEKYYGVDITKEFIATSVPASEHSLASTGIAVNGELETYRKWITQDYPTGIVSIIADTLDFFRVVTEFATELKDDILNRQVNEIGLAKVVFRPDSGCPVKVLCGDIDAPKGSPEYKGAVECLWEVFGGTENELGFKHLHERVGLIYGDSITLERAKEIFKRLASKGFASTNVVFGVGSFTSQYLSRDSAGMAVKATAAIVDGKLYELSKDPKTDDGMKKSAKGLLRVEKEGNNFILHDQQSFEQEQEGLLEVVYSSGNFYKEETFSTIRDRLWS
ncbi:nicotinate phosphoribosyltransferase [Rheinheimera phage vB_RspM_Barba19A]|jgi:nicotinamide phosphoribosyltransferase|uniref:Nicotinamide phosphoribosyltransferase n=2 Tax=Barbavirus barba19A TaxID=2734091 RepID=A0A4P8N4Q7_9CAUD|nr:nicotinamide phosphoribosyl transferase [Rheinheimera phage vB_RspM_Barba19A]QCQ61873.1 nicotinate phosphoribosyltransferase [Rheinheimera phage vB_RspM_Barba19A]QCQ64623.1 nicotinate phosphoribosyltransferase [Rheinheimera phage vB_RspM_Barba31A]